MAVVYCDQCQALAVNGTPVHEHGCANSRKLWQFRGRGQNKVCLPQGVEVPRYLQTPEAFPKPQLKPISQAIAPR